MNLDNSDDPITTREAFLAMAEFIWRFERRAGDDLITLLADIGLMPDGGPTDPAAWDDWVECVAYVKSGRMPRSIWGDDSG